MISFIIDENIFPQISPLLISYNFKVKDINNSKLKGISDEEIIKMAKEEKSIILTFDKHFADILKYPPENYFRIIRIRIHPPILNDIITAIRNFVNDFDLKKIKGKLIILEKDGFRIYPKNSD